MARLRQLWESLELEIVSVLEATNRLCESADYELHPADDTDPGVFRPDSEEAPRELGGGISRAGTSGGRAGEGDRGTHGRGGIIPPLGNKETATVVAGVSDPGYSLTPATARQPQSDGFREMGSGIG